MLMHFRDCTRGERRRQREAKNSDGMFDYLTIMSITIPLSRPLATARKLPNRAWLLTLVYPFRQKERKRRFPLVT